MQRDSRSVPLPYCSQDEYSRPQNEQCPPVNMENWVPKLDAPRWHFGPPNNDFGLGSRNMSGADADIKNDDGIGPSRLS
ncbi:hypothetical protein ACH5RR_018498 [Cinchona calisaya]|uniref:Uncharacterized protein n=1 Tax=Cinchona calisaya TaxID=153742 RepID=A0ABD2ZLL2_9GENT